MGLTKCKECGKEVSVDASICPHCGESFPGLSISCPKCGSTRIGTDKRGFSFGQATGGGLLLGPLGLLLGAAGRKDTVFCCQDCGYRWETQAKVEQNKQTQIGCLAIFIICILLYLGFTILPPYIRVISSRISSHIKTASLERQKQAYNKKAEKFLRKEPKSAEDYKLRGDIYLTQGKNDQAIIEYAKSIDINPKYAEAYVSRAGIYYKKGNYDQAVSDLTEAIQNNPNLSLAYFLRGGAYTAKKQYDKAYGDMVKAQGLGYNVSPKILDDLKAINQQASIVPDHIQGVVVLSGIFFDKSGKSSAILDGKLVFEGNNTNGIIIDKINKDSVDITVNGEKQSIRVK